MSTQSKILKERYAALRSQGVQDIKFVFAPLQGETMESVCGSVNEFLDAIERQEYDETPELGDSRRRKA